MENTTKKLQLIFGDVNLGVKGDHFHYIFSYQKNGLESLFVNGREWLYREPKLPFGGRQRTMIAVINFQRTRRFG